MAFNGKFVLNVAQYAAIQGTSLHAIIDQLPQTLEELCDDACIVSNIDYQNVIEKSVELTRDAHFGLHAGENLNLAAAGLIGQITQSCATVKQALEYCCEFANLGCSVLPMSLIEEEAYYKIQITPDQEWVAQSELSFEHTAAGVLAFSIREIESLTFEQNSPIKIHVPWTTPVDVNEYTRVLNTTVHFDQPELAIFLDKAYVEAKVINANYDLLRILVAHAQEKSLEIEQEQGFKVVVRQSVLKLIKPDFPNINEVAGHLNMSARTLQRKLKSEGITFQQMLAELRFDLAKSYLKNPQLSIKEISYLLNYAEPSVFIRFFKSRAGVTPKAFRE